LVESRAYKASRIIWKWMTGQEPPEIDHKDVDGLNDRWSNLRIATHSQNMHNVRVRPHNLLGIKGVRKVPNRPSYQARIRINDKLISLGYFKTIEGAQKAFALGARQYYGDFARTA
jgi:hypothetical protein